MIWNLARSSRVNINSVGPAQHQSDILIFHSDIHQSLCSDRHSSFLFLFKMNLELKEFWMVSSRIIR